MVEAPAPSWSIAGEYFENCNCAVVCPCLFSTSAPLTSSPTEGACEVAFAFHLERGAFGDVPLAGEWAAFVGVSLASLVALRPLARRLDRHGGSDGVGSRRLIGRHGTVLTAIRPGELGVVRVDREEWRAESADRTPIAEGAAVLITEVQGTRVIVTPNKEHTS